MFASLIPLAKQGACAWYNNSDSLPDHKPHAAYLTRIYWLQDRRYREKRGKKKNQNKTNKQKDWKQLFFFSHLQKNSRCKKYSWVTYLRQIIQLKLSCFLDPRHLGEVGGWPGRRVEFAALCPPNPLTSTHAHSTAALVSAIGIPLPKCLISWIVLNPHWSKLMVQNGNPTLRTKGCLVWVYSGRHVHHGPGSRGLGPSPPREDRIPPPCLPKQSAEENRRLA